MSNVEHIIINANLPADQQTSLDISDATARSAVESLQSAIESLQESVSIIASLQESISTLASRVEAISAENEGFEEYTVTSGAYIEGVTLKKGDKLTITFVSFSVRDDITAIVPYGAQSRNATYTTLITGGLAPGETKSTTITDNFPLLIITAYPWVQGGESAVIKLRLKIERGESTRASAQIGDCVASIFKKVVCIGDSYTSGYIQIDDDHNYPNNPDYSWVASAGRITAQNWLNYGVSGSTAKTWQTNSGGLAQVRQITGVSAYVIGLGINDVMQGAALGTIDDVGTSSDTYYKNMSDLIEALHGICDKAKIFVNTIPAPPERHAIPTSNYDSSGYNTAIRNLVAHYKGLGYPIHCIDLASEDNISYYTNANILTDYRYLHYTPIAYQQFGEIYVRILSRYIIDNVLDFQDVFLIPTA